MFLYWDGYEIDGSDTDFDIVLPESVQLLEFTEHFLRIPIFCDVPPPEFMLCSVGCDGHWHDKSCKKASLEKIKTGLLNGDCQNFTMTVNSLHPDLISPEILSQIYAKSEGRSFNEDPDLFSAPKKPFDHTKTENPGIAPVIQTDFERGGFTMQLRVYKNEEGLPAASLNVGPGAYYEYVMYVLDYMKARFPGTETDLDGGMATCGCTFSASLYSYEKIRIPIKYNLKNTLKWLTEYGLMSFNTYYKKSKHFIDYASDGFFPASLYWDRDKKDPLPFKDYLEFAELALTDEKDQIRQLFTTVVNIFFPSAKVMDGKLPLIPRSDMDNMQMRDHIWPYTGYMAFYTENGETICEIRIRAEKKAAFLDWLNRAESGVIEFIKAQVFELRSGKT